MIEKNNIKKRDITRAKILGAARTVFSKESYNAASIRMIATEGGFDFGIIRYHFPNKAELFKVVFKQCCNEFLKGHEQWVKEAVIHRTEGVEKNFIRYIDRLINFHSEHPENLRIIMNNIYMSDDPKFEIPGYEYLPELITKCREIFNDNNRMAASLDEIHRFNDCMDAMIFTLLGGGSYQAKALGVDPHSKEYYQWVKDTLVYLFLPHLKRLFF